MYDAGAVDDNLQAAELLDGLFDRALHFARPASLRARCYRLAAQAAQLPDQGLPPLDLHVGDRHARTLLGKQLSHRGADSRRPAADPGNLPFKFSWRHQSV